MKADFWVRRIVMFILIGAVAVLVFGGAVMLLWNNILAQVTNVHPITFLQALGILVLSKILFGGFIPVKDINEGYLTGPALFFRKIKSN